MTTVGRRDLTFFAAVACWGVGGLTAVGAARGGSWPVGLILGVFWAGAGVGVLRSPTWWRRRALTDPRSSDHVDTRTVSRYADADGWDVEMRWKEQVIYWEGPLGFVFDGAWGVSPPQTFVPDAETWDRAVPDWLHGRRDEVVRRLEEAPIQHQVIEENARQWGEPEGRIVTRP